MTSKRSRRGLLLAVVTAAGPLVPAGCSGGTGGPAPVAVTPGTRPAGPAGDHAAEVRAERDKLPPEDRTLVDAQEWCAVSTGERLGAMGPPLKVTVKGEPVFLCCEGCQRKALADPDATLAAVAGLKARAKAERDGK